MLVEYLLFMVLFLCDFDIDLEIDILSSKFLDLLEDFALYDFEFVVLAVVIVTNFVFFF